MTQFDGTTTTKTWAIGSTDFTFTPNPISAGTTNVRVKYGRYENCTYNIPITTLKKAKSFTINAGAIDKYYVAGNTFSATNLHNLEASVINEDDTTETITYAAHPDYFTFTPALGTALAVTNANIVIGLKGKTLDYAIVVEPTGNASSATEGTRPTKVNYITGDPFDPRGLVINVSYPGGITKVIEYNDETKNNFTFNPNPFAVPPETLTYGTDHVEVIYKGVTINIPVTIRKEIQDFTVIDGPTNTEFSKGDTFDPNGIKIQVTYTDTTTEVIEYNDSTKDLFTFTPDINHKFDNTDVGNKVQISVGGLTPQVIDDMDDVYDNSVSAVILDADGNPQVVHNISRDDFIQSLDNAINNGAIGFHEYAADGINDAKNKYDKYAPKTMTKSEAVAKYDEYVAAGLTTSKFIGTSYDRPVSSITLPVDIKVNRVYTAGDKFNPTGLEIIVNYVNGVSEIIKYSDHKSEFTFNPSLNTAFTINNKMIDITYAGKTVSLSITVNKKDNPRPEPYYPSGGGGSSSGGESSPSKGPMGDLTKNPEYVKLLNDQANQQVNTNNSLLQTNLMADTTLALNLLAYPENANMPRINAEDVNSNWYGRVVTGQHNIAGIVYNFDSTGALIQ